MHNFKQLGVWRKSIELTTQIHTDLTNNGKMDQDSYKTLRAKAVNMAVYIAEGAGCSDLESFCTFLQKALSTSCELETHLTIASELKAISGDNYSQLIDRINEIQRMLNGLIRSIQKKVTKNENV